MLDEVFYRQTNKHLVKVEPTKRTVTTKEGTTIDLEGWYYPKKYDPELSSATAQNMELNDFMETMTAVFNQNRLDQGFTNARQQNVKRPILLNTSVLVDHLNTATRWATRADAPLEFEALTTDPDVRDAIIDKLGRAKYQYIREWANRMVKPDKGMKSGANKIFLGLRKASTVASLGLNLRSASRQNESLGIAADKMSNSSRTKSSGWFWLFQGLKRMGASGFLGGFMPGPARQALGLQSAAVAEMYETSDVARMRAGNPNKELRELTQGADPTRSRGMQIGSLCFSTDWFFHFTYAMDQGVSGVCWWGAYMQAESGNAGFDIEGMSDTQIREKSIAYADAILLTQQSPYKADVTNFQADPGIQSLFTQFMGGVTPYLSHSAGMYQAWRRGDKNALDMVRHLANVYALPAFGYAIVPTLIARAITGGDDDDESLVAKFAMAMASNMTAPLPGIREAVGAAEYGWQSMIPPSFSTPGKAISRGWKGVKKLSQGEIGTATEDFARAAAVYLPLYTPYRQAKQLGQMVGVVEEE